jgi:hypothetical protein
MADQMPMPFSSFFCVVSGSLPAKWGASMKKLRYLTIQASHLTGPIPAEFAGMNTIIRMQLGNNELTGVLAEGVLCSTVWHAVTCMLFWELR